MPRPVSKDPTLPVTVTLPRSIKNRVARAAEAEHLSTSAFIAKALREYFHSEKAGK